MPTLYLVRHGQAEAGFGNALDPGLNGLGREQARSSARALFARTHPIPVFTSPLRRCQETAAPLIDLWHCHATLLPEVAEIPSPFASPEERGPWLKSIMDGSWEEAVRLSSAVDLRAWRLNLLNALLNIREDAVIFTHFIAINVAAGSALKDERMMCFRPDNASIHIFTHDDGHLTFQERGAEAITQVR